jgi:hypothetical protein
MSTLGDVAQVGPRRHPPQASRNRVADSTNSQPDPALAPAAADGCSDGEDSLRFGLSAVRMGERFGEVPDDVASTLAAGIQVRVVDADRPARASGRGQGRAGDLA